MKRVKNTLAAIIAVAMAFTFTSCEAARPPAFVGHWLHESGSTKGKPEDMELFNDGTGVCDRVTISWKVEDKRFVLLSSLMGFTSDYEVSGYRLTLTDKEGKSSTYVNISDKSYQKKCGENKENCLTATKAAAAKEEAVKAKAARAEAEAKAIAQAEADAAAARAMIEAFIEAEKAEAARKQR
jgi:hypothetical protein